MRKPSRRNHDNYKIHATHAKGAANELYVAAWYLRQGFNVFWPTAQQGPVDFVLDQNNTLYRVQVKTAHIIMVESYGYLQCRINRLVLFDKLVVVGPKGHIWDVPKASIEGRRSIYFNGPMKRSGYNSDDWLLYKPELPFEQSEAMALAV